MFGSYRYWCARIAVAMLALTTLAFGAAPRAQVRLPAGSDPKPANGIDFVQTTLDKYPIVAIGDLPGCEELHDFILALVRNPAFGSKVNNVIVDFGNPLFQPVIDRYVL